MEGYSQILLKTIGKVYQLPYYQSQNYLYLLNEINDILMRIKSNPSDRQTPVEKLHAILSRLNRLPPREGRIEERIGTIVEMVKSQNLRPRTILDIGAGTGEILLGLKNFYNLDTENVFAIDNKLPNIDKITPLTYQNGTIPLPDNSIDLVVMLMTLHHIPIEARPGIVSEISRVLSPNGVVIIREHDNNYDPDFYTFLDGLHLFWYLASGETPDPLFLMTRVETSALFNQAGLQSASYSKYSEPNPQQIYHEMFIKHKVVRPYKFFDPDAQNTLQVYVNKVRMSPQTLVSFYSVIPRKLQQVLHNKYGSLLQSDISKVWPDIIKEYALALIITSVKYSPLNDNVYYITSDAINRAYMELS